MNYVASICRPANSAEFSRRSVPSLSVLVRNMEQLEAILAWHPSNTDENGQR